MIEEHSPLLFMVFSTPPPSSLSFFLFINWNHLLCQGFYEHNEASITVYLDEDRYPIDPPEDRIKCEDVPDDVCFFN